MFNTNLPDVGYGYAQINDAGDRVVWAVEPVNPDRWLLVEGHRLPIQGNALILGPEGSDGPSIDMQWVTDNVDFGEVQTLGTTRMFLGERHRRPLD